MGNYRGKSVVEFLELVRVGLSVHRTYRYPRNSSNAWKDYVGEDEAFEKGLIREKIPEAITFLRN